MTSRAVPRKPKTVGPRGAQADPGPGDEREGRRAPPPSPPSTPPAATRRHHGRGSRRCTSEATSSATANTTPSAKFCFTITAAPGRDAGERPPARRPATPPVVRRPGSARSRASPAGRRRSPRRPPALISTGVTANAAATSAAQRAPRSPTTWWAAQAGGHDQQHREEPSRAPGRSAASRSGPRAGRAPAAAAAGPRSSGRRGSGRPACQSCGDHEVAGLVGAQRADEVADPEHHDDRAARRARSAGGSARASGTGRRATRGPRHQ